MKIRIIYWPVVSAQGALRFVGISATDIPEEHLLIVRHEDIERVRALLARHDAQDLLTDDAPEIVSSRMRELALDGDSELGNKLREYIHIQTSINGGSNG